MRAEPHPEQADRIRTLHSYGILDTPREQDFDDIVALAARICEVPISVVNLIDEARQWFKAEVGLGVRETPLETSICAHAILQDDFVEIHDTLADPRMADNPLCLGNPGLRFYAGARLLAANGLPLGTLCVLDSEPRRLNDLQREALRVLSRQVVKQLELRLALRNEADLRAEMDHRIKNSLQATSSLVRMYGRNVQDAAAKDAFIAIQSRIDSMAALHEQLQMSGGDATIDMPAYLAQVAALLEGAATEKLTVTSVCDPLFLPQGHASDIGMIVSEFTANAIKHGFPDDRTGTVTISLRERVPGRLTLEARDDGQGSGLEQGEDAGAKTGIGARLLDAAASKLGGPLEHRLTSSGARLTLAFPRPS